MCLAGIDSAQNPISPGDDRFSASHHGGDRQGVGNGAELQEEFTDKGEAHSEGKHQIHRGSMEEFVCMPCGEDGEQVDTGIEHEVEARQPARDPGQPAQAMSDEH